MNPALALAPGYDPHPGGGIYLPAEGGPESQSATRPITNPEQLKINGIIL
jgi:hypothetical protein